MLLLTFDSASVTAGPRWTVEYWEVKTTWKGFQAMTPEESSIFFNLLSGVASEPARRFIDFLADPDAGDWDEGITETTYRVADYIAGDLQEHARGCELPIAKCQLCRLCELEIKRMWPDLWLSKWPGATTAEETYEFTEAEFVVIFAMCWSGGSWRLNKEQIAEQLGIGVGIVHTIMRRIFEKDGLSSRPELFEFARTALNAELRRRRPKPNEP